MDIDPLKNLKNLKVLSVFHNEIFHFESFLGVLTQIDLEELSYDANPIARDFGIKYKIIMNTKIQMIDEDKVSELDYELAENYYKNHNLELPKTEVVLV